MSPIIYFFVVLVAIMAPKHRVEFSLFAVGVIAFGELSESAFILFFILFALGYGGFWFFKIFHLFYKQDKEEREIIRAETLPYVEDMEQM